MNIINKTNKAFVVIPIAIIVAATVLATGTAYGLVMNEKKKMTRETAVSSSCSSTTYGSEGDRTFTFPDKSKAVRTEERTFHVTSYCPPKEGNDVVEGGQSTASGINVGFGSVAVPPFSFSNPDITSSTPDYPFGTLFEIPNYGTGVAMDKGCAIQKANTPASCKKTHYAETKYDHLDVFVGNGSTACSHGVSGDIKIKVYWFDQSADSEYRYSKITTFLKPITKDGSSLGASNCTANTTSSAAAGVCGARVLSVATQEVGKSYLNDKNPYSNSSVPWCAAFASWVYKQAGFLKSVHPGTVDLQEDTSELTIVKVNNDINNIKPGDIFWKATDESATGWHVGVVEAIGTDGRVSTIEGNVGKVGNTDRVARRKQKVTSIQYVARPKTCNK